MTTTNLIEGNNLKGKRPKTFSAPTLVSFGSSPCHKSNALD